MCDQKATHFNASDVVSSGGDAEDAEDAEDGPPSSLSSPKKKMAEMLHRGLWAGDV